MQAFPTFARAGTFLVKRKKAALRLFAWIAVAVVCGVLVSPYHRQLVFGPTIRDEPLCVWQEAYRRGRVQGRKETLSDKIRQWFQRERQPMAFWNLSTADQCRLYVSMLDEADSALGESLAKDLGALSLRGDAAAQHALARFLDDRRVSVRQNAALALRTGFKQDALAFLKLKGMLQHAEATRRSLAVTTLSYARPRDRALLDLISPRLRDADGKVRAAAAAHLGSWTNRKVAATCIPQLLQMLQDDDAACRVESAYAVWRVGKKTPEAIGVLQAELRHGQAEARKLAAQYLRRMNGAAQSAFNELVHCAFNDPDVQVREAAALALGNCGPRAVPVLREMIEHYRNFPTKESSMVRVSAIGALRTVGPAAKELGPLLLSCLPEYGTLEALRALKSREIVPDLIALINQGKEREEAIILLGDLGPDAKEAVPALLALLRPDDQPGAMNTKNADGALCRKLAAIALCRIGAEIETALPIVLQVFEDVDWNISEDAKNALGQLGTRAKAIVHEYRGRLRNKSRDVRGRAAMVLAGIGPEAASAIPGLLDMLQDDLNGLDFMYAVEALGRIGLESEKVVPAITTMLGDFRPVVRHITIQALGRFGPRAKSAVPDLIRLLDYDEPWIAEAAAAALANIDPKRFGDDPVDP